MLTAIVVHSPVPNAPVKSFNEGDIKALPGVHDVFVMDIPQEITHFRSGKGRVRPQNGASQPGIAIVADNYWSAQKARKVLMVEWGDSEFADFDSDEAIRTFFEHVDDEGKKTKTAGNAKDAFEKSAQVVEATYSMPYKAHAQLEPISMIAWVKPDEVEYWGGAQVPTRCAQAAETIAGVSRDKVKIHITEAGGSFGNREGLHWMLEVTYISKRVNRPVKLLYSREDDIRQLYYHSASVHKARAALTPDGQVKAFSLRAVVPSIKEPDDPGFLENMPVDPSCTEAMRDDFYYDIEGLDLAWVRHEPGLPIWWWRAVSYVPNVFAIESLIDEAAVSAGQDPYQYRRLLLKNRPEHLAVLDRAAKMAGWPMNDNNGQRALGIATYEGYKSYIAVVADVTVKDNAITINHITCAVDCGLTIDPSSAHHQIYGGIVWGISTALHDEITVRKGQVVQSNYHDYPVPRMANVPPIDVEFMPPSDRQPGGVGELSNSVVAPAIGNAIYAAVGQRLRSTPFRMA